MARTFQMGAKMTLKDQFKGTISRITRDTMDFKKSVDITNKSVRGFGTDTGKLPGAFNKYSSAVKNADKTSGGLLTTMGRMRKTSMLLQWGIRSLATGFGLFAAKRWLVDSNADMETYKNTLTVVLKDEKKAVEMLAWASKFAATTPFEIPQIVEATTRMAAYGINAQKTLGIVGDMAAVMGKDLMQAVEAVADSQTGEMERLKEFGITKKMIEAQAKLMKVTVTNNQGQITDQKAFNAVLFKLMEDRFKGGMAMQAKTWKGMMSNLKDFMGSMGRTLGAPVFEALKGQLKKVMDFTQTLNDNGTLTKWGDAAVKVVAKVGKAINNARGYISTLIYIIRKRFSSVYTDNKPFIDKLMAAFYKVVNWIKVNLPAVLNWLAYTGIPMVISGLSTVADWVLKVSSWFVENWGWIKPIIMGIVTAWGAYLAIGASVLIATKAWTMAQAALNFVMNLNPIGFIVTGIGILIGLIYLLIKNWDTVVAAFKMGANAIGSAFVGVFTGIMAAVKPVVNFLIGAVNLLIKGLNSLKVDVPDWVPLVGGKKFGFNIPEIPYLAKGTKNWQGGPAYMNERGGELAVLPGGSQVIPADKTDKVLEGKGGVTIQNLIGKLEIHQQPGEDSESFAQRVITLLFEKLSNAAEIANNDEMGVLVNG